MVAEQEAKPKAVLYPRDPSLDPQLVWKGKDEQDRQPLEVPAVPIYRLCDQKTRSRSSGIISINGCFWPRMPGLIPDAVSAVATDQKRSNG